MALAPERKSSSKKARPSMMSLNWSMTACAFFLVGDGVDVDHYEHEDG